MCATSSSAFDGSATAELRSRATTACVPAPHAALPPESLLLSALAIYFAASASLPGGFVVLILIKSSSQICASLARAVVSPSGECVANRRWRGLPASLAGRGSALRPKARRSKHCVMPIILTATKARALPVSARNSSNWASRPAVSKSSVAPRRALLQQFSAISASY